VTPHSVHAGPEVPQVLAHVEVLVAFVMHRLKQPSSPHAVFVPHVLAQVDVLVAFLMHTS
jgi:hypothetical protein